MNTGELTKIIEQFDYPEDVPRYYIGASAIGSDCLRQIWYESNGYQGEDISNKLKRTWEIGKRLEDLVFDCLKQAGLEISRFSIDLVDSSLSYFKGHVDALMFIKGITHAIIEIKTAKDSSFKQFKNQGLKKWSSRYYAQIQAYMGMSGIYSAYILVLNKDNSDIWDEKIEYDAYFYGMLRNKAQDVYESKTIPLRINNSPLWFQCKMCKFNRICHV